MQRLGFGLSLRDGTAFQRQRVAFPPAGDGGFFLVLLTIYGTPSGLPDDAAFHRELHSGTLRRDGSGVLDAFLGERLDHAPGNHLIDGVVFFGEEQRFLSRDEQGVVVRHLATVHASACRDGFRLHLAFPFGQSPDEGEQLGDFGEHVFGDVARIGDELLLVELLRDFKRLFRREAVLGVGFLLERGQVVQERCFLRLLLAFGFRDGGCACRLHLIIQFRRGLFLFPFFGRGKLHSSFVAAVRCDMELPEGFGREAAVLPVACAHHRQCRCLHPPDGVSAVSGGDGECLRAVDAHEPVRFAPRFGGKIEVVVFAARFKVAQSLADSLVGKRAYPEADERGGASGVMVEVAENKLTLASGIGRHDDLFTFLE